MNKTSQALDSTASYHFVKQMVDQLSWHQKERLKREIDLGTPTPTLQSIPVEAQSKPASTHTRLTSREQQVLALIADGYTRREVGAALKISHNTASCHVSHIYEKLQVSTIAEATRAAIRLGMLSESAATGSTRASRRA